MLRGKSDKTESKIIKENASKISECKRTRSRGGGPVKVAVANECYQAKQMGEKSPKVRKTNKTDANKVAKRLDFNEKSNEPLNRSNKVGSNVDPPIETSSRMLTDEQSHPFNDGIQVIVNTDECGEEEGYNEGTFTEDEPSEYDSEDSEPDSNFSEVVISSASKRIQAQEKGGLKALFTEFLQETLCDPQSRDKLSDMVVKANVAEQSTKTGKGDCDDLQIRQQTKSNLHSEVSVNVNANRIKSPSDTTIYAPALKNIGGEGNSFNNLQLRNISHIGSTFTGHKEAINQISDFVEAVRLNTAIGTDMARPGTLAVGAADNE